MDQVYVCGTYFHIYVSILISISTKNSGSKNLIVINDHTPEVEKIFSALESSGYFFAVVQVPFRKIDLLIKSSGFLPRIIGRNKKATGFVDKYSDITRYDSFIRNAEINLFYNLGLTPAYFLLKYKNNFIRMIEDGERNYHSKISGIKAFKRKYLLNTVIGDGMDTQIKEILVQQTERLNIRVVNKGRKLELKKMQDELSVADRQKILSIFMQGRHVSLVAGKKLILITQPFSEEKYFDEKTKIQLYNDVLSEYADDYIIFIKPHPRELTNYNGKINYPFTEIPGSFPLEMMNLLSDIHFDLGITLYSGAINNINGIIKKIKLGKELLSKYQ
jgi:Glycosyltransferase family 52